MSPLSVGQSAASPLSVLLVDMLTAVTFPLDGALRVQSVSLNLPVEVHLQQCGDELVFLANLPQWRWPTDFDERRGRINLICAEGDLA